MTHDDVEDFDDASLLAQRWYTSNACCYLSSPIRCERPLQPRAPPKLDDARETQEFLGPALTEHTETLVKTCTSLRRWRVTVCIQGTLLTAETAWPSWTLLH